MGFDKEIEIDIGRWIRSIVQKWWLIVITTLCGGGMAFALSSTIQPVYSAQTILCSAGSTNYKDATEILYYLQEYAVISGRSVAERAEILLGNGSVSADDIKNMVDYDYEEGEMVLFIEVSNENSELALNVADAVAESFVIETQSMLGYNAVSVLEKATLQDSGISTNRICIFGAALGLIFPIIIIVFIQIMSDKIYYVSDAELGGELDIIGVIPEQV